MHSGFVTYKSSRVHYSCFGTGSTILVCLHGYGESEQSFHFLEKYLPNDYKAIAIDFPHHGKTEWNENEPVTAYDLIVILEKISDEQALELSNFRLLGFSMGGRAALQITQQVPSQVKQLTLLAPDGLKVNFWYWLATQTWIGLRLFHFTMKHPQWFRWMLQAGKKLGLVNLSIYKFTQYYIHDKTVRRQLFDRWTCMRKIKPKLTLVKKYIHDLRIPVQLVYGEYDRIIRHERGEKFKAGIEPYCTLQIIPSGHQLLQEKHAGLVIKLIQS